MMMPFFFLDQCLTLASFDRVYRNSIRIARFIIRGGQIRVDNPGLQGMGTLGTENRQSFIYSRDHTVDSTALIFFNIYEPVNN